MAKCTQLTSLPFKGLIIVACNVLMLAAVRQLKEIRERMKKNRTKKSRSSKRKSSDDDKNSDDNDSSVRKLSKKSKKSRTTEDAEKPSDSSKGSRSVSKKGSSRSEKESESSSSKKKQKQAVKKSANSSADDSANLEDESITGGKRKQNVAAQDCLENSDKPTDELEDCNSASVDEVVPENGEDENAAENSVKSKQSKTSKKAVNDTGCCADGDDDDDDLDRELQNLGKFPKLRLKASRVKACEEVEKSGDGPEVDTNGDAPAAETATSKPESAKKGL